jgi:hypothetical protein
MRGDKQNSSLDFLTASLKSFPEMLSKRHLPGMKTKKLGASELINMNNQHFGESLAHYTAED